MGFDVRLGQSKEDLVKELTTSVTRGWETWGRPLHRLIDNTLWVVEDMITVDARGTKTERHRQIVCYELSFSSYCNGWGKRAATERCVPLAYNCPLEFLDAAPVHSAEWRIMVKAYHSGECKAASEAAELRHRLLRERYPELYK